MSKPESGKIYRLTGAPDKPSLAAGNDWDKCEVKHPNLKEDWRCPRCEVNSGQATVNNVTGEVVCRNRHSSF